MEDLGIQPKKREHKAGKIRLSEVFVSVQGEGPRVGKPTVFFRTAGCPFRCSGWGVKTTLPDGRVVEGCDSPHSVWPEIYNQPGGSTLLTPEEAVDRIPDYPKNICLTGGEPLLQKRSLTSWLKSVLDLGHTVDVFTNGMIVVPSDLDEVWVDPRVSYVMDYKPMWSGEGGKFKEKNFELLREQDAVKFVCRNYEDYLEACRVIDGHPEFRGRWYVGAVLGILKPSEIVEWLIKDQRQNVELNLQTQAYIGLDVPISKQDSESFDNSERFMNRIVGN